MGMMERILGIGGTARDVGAAVGGVAEVFVGNRAERDAADHGRFTTVLGQYGAEFATAGRGGRFDRFVNALNRLPRPLMTIGTLGLFVYAMVEPVGFGLRMRGLELVPEPLWWLLGAIVSFYFGARELHHQRVRTGLSRVAGAAVAPPIAAPLAEPVAAFSAAGLAEDAPPAGVATEASALPPALPATDPDYNAAVEEWRRTVTG